jgi:N-acylglucosamine 2-epimerase
LKNESSDLQKKYWDKLISDVVPFWLKNSIDTKNGGYWTCLDEKGWKLIFKIFVFFFSLLCYLFCLFLCFCFIKKGKVYDTDKFVWLQGRQIWTLSKLFNCVSDSEVKSEEKQKYVVTGKYNK